MELVKSLKEQIDILKSEIYFLCKEIKEKNNILKMFFHSAKLFPQEIALTSSSSKDIIKGHNANLTLNPLVQSNLREKPSNDAVNEMSANNMKKKVFIMGYSMVKKVDGYLLTNSIKRKYLVKVRPS